MKSLPIVIAVIVAFLGLSIVSGSWYTVDQGERGVLLRNGAVTGTAEPGLGFKVPFIDEIRYISTQTHTTTYQDVLTYSQDNQIASLRLSVTYQLLPGEVETVYALYGSEDNIVSRVVTPRVLEQAKNVFGQFNAVAAIQQRARLNAEIFDAIAVAVSGPISIVSVQIENIDFSDAYETAAEQRALAEVEVQRIRQQAEREKVQAEIVVIKATAEADAVRQAAAAQAEAIRLLGDAEAAAIEARGAALRDNPGVVALVQAERWNGVLPTTMPPNGSVPFLNLN